MCIRGAASSHLHISAVHVATSSQLLQHKQSANDFIFIIYIGLVLFFFFFTVPSVRTLWVWLPVTRGALGPWRRRSGSIGFPLEYQDASEPTRLADGGDDGQALPTGCGDEGEMCGDQEEAVRGREGGGRGGGGVVEEEVEEEEEGE